MRKGRDWKGLAGMEVLTSQQYREQVKAPRKGRFPRSSAEQRTCDGITFDSKREMLRWQKLRLKEIAGLIFDLKRQTQYSVEINGQHYCRVTWDFEYTTAEGRAVIEDVKSTGTAKDPAYRLRKRAFEIYYGVEVSEVLKP